MQDRRRLLVLLWSALLAGGFAGGAQADGVLVFGGTGQLGARIVKRLVADGEEVTVFVRPGSDRGRLEALDVAYVVGDMLQESDVATALAAGQHRVVINAVRAPISDTPFYDITSRNLIKAAKASGVQQIIHHGAVGAGNNMALHPDIPWDRVPGLKARMLDHGAAEANFFNSGIATTVIRNSRVWPDETPASGNAELTEDQSVLTPITRVDLAAMTMQCLDNPDCNNKIYHARDETLSWPPPGWGE